MSNVPSGAWSPPPPVEYGGSSARGNPAASLGWRLAHSLWLLVPLLGFSCLSGLGLIFIGLRAKRPAWWIPGIVYTLLGWAAFIFAGESEAGSSASQWSAGLWMALWLAALLHSVLVNASWLRWRANWRPWYTQGGPAPAGSDAHLAPPSAMPAPSPYAAWDPAATLTPPPGTYYAADPVAVPVPDPTSDSAQAAAQVQPPPLPGPSAVDVNAARLDQLAALPGFDSARAQHVLTERAKRGSFGSVTEFVAVANLAPHEYARLRDVLVCPPPATFGQQDGTQPPLGRVVDV